MARSLQIVAAICSIAAAALWWMASGQIARSAVWRVRRGRGNRKNLRAAVRRAALMNCAAALLSLIAAALTIGSLIFSRVSGQFECHSGRADDFSRRQFS